MKMNKKAVTFSTMNLLFWRFLFIGVSFAIIVYLAFSSIQENVDVQQTKNFILVNRMLYSPNSITYVDPNTGRVYPDIIDLTKFNEKVLNKSINTDKNQIAVKLELKNLDANEVIDAYLNQKWYDRWSPLVKFEQYSKTIKWRSVLIKKGDQINKGRLRIDVVSASE
ncbi:hypothetical protein KY331_02030 [Candidatus Woesearchaeota archaeon]|nr:hypothetical protein [Candidatus Woesearchaeota archaeon]